MEIILLKNIKNIGDIGTVIKVKSGYARNYLIPTGQALLATKKNIKYLENQTHQLKQKINIQISHAKSRMNYIQSLDPINIFSQVSETGKLFGSIGIQEIANAINNFDCVVKKHEFHLEHGPIRHIGKYKVMFSPHKEVSCWIIVNVIAKK